MQVRLIFFHPPQMLKLTIFLSLSLYLSQMFFSCEKKYRSDMTLLKAFTKRNVIPSQAPPRPATPRPALPHIIFIIGRYFC